MESNTLVDAVTRRPLMRRAVRPVAAFALVVLAGVAGFSALGGVGLVNALFWLLDPTSIELHFRTHEGPARLVKAYAVVVLSGLVVSSIWIGETVLSAAFGGQIRRELKHMHGERTIDELDDHVVICGYGTFGKTVAARLCEKDHDVVVVEHQDAQHDRAIEDGMLAVAGDARRDEMLTDAGIGRARTVVGAVDDANVNIQMAISASQLAPDVDIVVRVGDEMDEALARRAGADEVVVPEIVSGEQMCANL